MDLDIPIYPRPLQQNYFIVDTEDLLGKLFDELHRRQEKPIVNFNDEGIREWFMRDICNLLAYGDQGGVLARHIDVCLKRCEGYLNQPFNQVQRLLWRRFTFDLNDRLRMHQLFADPDNYCTHDYVRMIGHNILMRQYGD